MPKTVMEMADDILATMGVSDAVPLSEAKQEPVHAVGKTYEEDLPEVNDEQRMQFIQESMTVGKKIKKLKKEGKPQDQAVAIALDMKDDGKLKEMYAVQGNPTGPDGRNFDNAWKLSKKDRAKLSGEKCNEDLRKWVAEKWVDIGAPKKGGGFKPCGRSKGEKRKGYPKCVPSSKAASMSKSERTSAVRRKRAAGNTGPKPTNVKTMKESYVIEAKLCARGKAAAKRKFKVYPSAYANMYASAVCSGKVTPGGKKGKKKSVKESDNHFPDENKATNTADEIKKMRKVNLKEKMEKSDKGTEAQQARRAASKAISSATRATKTMKNPQSKLSDARKAALAKDEHFKKYKKEKEKTKGKGAPHTSKALRSTGVMPPQGARWSTIKDHLEEGKSPAWQRKEGKNPEGGLNKKGVASYRAANPGSKLKTAVTTKPSKLKKGSKAASRRKSFCARMAGMKRKRTSSKTANDPDSRINKSLRKWNCNEMVDVALQEMTAVGSLGVNFAGKQLDPEKPYNDKKKKKDKKKKTLDKFIMNAFKK